MRGSQSKTASGYNPRLRKQQDNDSNTTTCTLASGRSRDLADIPFLNNEQEQDTIDSEERCYWMEIVQLPIDNIEEDPMSLLKKQIEFLMEQRE